MTEELDETSVIMPTTTPAHFRKEMLQLINILAAAIVRERKTEVESPSP